MPIIEPVDPSSPLTQGDILTNVTLFATKESWLGEGGETVKTPFKLCLVVSRPCVVSHKRHILVAGVDKYPDSVPKEANTFEAVLVFLTTVRDGSSSPDVFYLGQLPSRGGRFCARLDSLHAIEVPTEPATRGKFVEEKRVARLHPDFARDLHVRLFNAFASLGFEDYRWPSTQDLEWLVSQGRADIASTEKGVHQLQAQKASREAEGKQFSEAELVNAEARLAGLRQKVQPYEEELARRREPSLPG